MKRNAEIEHFTEPSKVEHMKFQNPAPTAYLDIPLPFSYTPIQKRIVTILIKLLDIYKTVSKFLNPSESDSVQ